MKRTPKYVEYPTGARWHEDSATLSQVYFYALLGLISGIALALDHAGTPQFFIGLTVAALGWCLRRVARRDLPKEMR